APVLADGHDASPGQPVERPAGLLHRLGARAAGDQLLQLAADEAGRRPPDLSLALELGAQPPAVDPRRGRVVGSVGEGHGVVDQTPGAGRWRGEGATVGARPGAQDLVVAAGAL